MEAGARILERERLLSHLMRYDQLTGVLTRRSFFEELDAQWAASVRERRPLSCVMADVDHFKQVNDEHGHLAGDEALKAVGAVLKRCAADRAVVGRYGGEEFCAIFPGEGADRAAAFAEQCREGIAMTPLVVGGRAEIASSPGPPPRTTLLSPGSSSNRLPLGRAGVPGVAVCHCLGVAGRRLGRRRTTQSGNEQAVPHGILRSRRGDAAHRACPPPSKSGVAWLATQSFVLNVNNAKLVGIPIALATPDQSNHYVVSFSVCSTIFAVPVDSGISRISSCCWNFARTTSRMTATLTDSQSRRRGFFRSRPMRAAIIGDAVLRIRSWCSTASNFCAWK